MLSLVECQKVFVVSWSSVNVDGIEARVDWSSGGSLVVSFGHREEFMIVLVGFQREFRYC